MNPTIRFILTLLLGWTGIQRFLDHKIGTGILYLCTFGLFGIGWFVDVCIALFHLVTFHKTTRPSKNDLPEDHSLPAPAYTSHTSIPSPSIESGAGCKILRSSFVSPTAKNLEGICSYVVLDTETTGLDRKNDRIVEISLARYENGVQTDHYATLVNPQIPIPPAASRVNHITDTDVATAPTFAQIWPDVCRMVQDVLIVGHNVTFDLDMIGYAIPDSAASLNVQYLDTLTLSKKAFPGRSTYKLANLVKDLGISSTQTHRADDDVVLTAQLFERCRFEIMDAYRKELEARRAAREQARAEKAARFGWSPMLNKNFVFTGDFQQNREKLESSLEKIGANLRDNVNGNTDYLVKGSLTNLPDWAVERKYSKAVTLSQNGKKVKIIDESEYISLLQQVLQMAPTHQ
ncbi:exonuclease domain-containing protein [uncultured Subdoligranulum sp.]|uniref:exonuclease domain-containing protein n=1 Tax=uncultured Subdoligranulum sp. TaxID=512298 RepID=UPI0026068421|nr:exonuclease domain-containing protein [uncultured Subdoligranulum sp.]